MQEDAGSCTIRRSDPADAPGILNLIEVCRWGPVRDGIHFDVDDLVRGMEENGFVASFVAVSPDGVIVGWGTLNAVSVQYASAPGGVMGDHLVVHPDFRSGVVAGKLLASIQAEVARLGYRRIDTVVERLNRLAMATYRRVGFRQVSDSPCEDDALRMENHTPMLLPYLRSAGFEDRRLRHPTGDPRFYIGVLRPPGGTLGASDVRLHHGATCLDHEFHLHDDVVRLTVDRTLGTVTHVVHEGICEIDLLPVEGRAVDIGTVATFAVDVHNLGEEPLDVDFVPTLLIGSPRVPDGTRVTVDGGETRSWEASVRATTPLRHRVDLSVAVTVHDRTITWPVSTWFESTAPGSDDDTHWWSGTRSADGWSLDLRTGVLRAWRDRTVALEELWPDVGPPFPGGWKEPMVRTLSVLDVDDQAITVCSPANVWITAHEALASTAAPRGLDGVQVERRLSRRDEVLQVDTTVRVPAGRGPVCGWLRTWPRARMTDARLEVPDRSGWAIDDEPAPWRSTNFEFVRPGRLPSSPDDLDECWSAFVGRDGAVGCAFPGATEVRYGDLWMPSVLYRVDIDAGPSTLRLPTYYLAHASSIDDLRVLFAPFVPEPAHAGHGPT